jgi:hypothetical protein
VDVTLTAGRAELVADGGFVGWAKVVLVVVCVSGCGETSRRYPKTRQRQPRNQAKVPSKADREAADGKLKRDLPGGCGGHASNGARHSPIGEPWLRNGKPARLAWSRPQITAMEPLQRAVQVWGEAAGAATLLHTGMS